MSGEEEKQTSAVEGSNDYVICNGNGDNVDITKKPINLSVDSVINLDHGDPKFFATYWKENDEKCSITIKASQLVSYFSNAGKICWYMEPTFANAVTRLHAVVGNAVTENKHLVVGTGSSQLFQAALYAISSTSSEEALPLSVVCAAPYYSNYPELTDMLKSGLYKWAGDANAFVSEKDHPYIEVVCSPNNPDGTIRKPVVKSGEGEGKVIYDLAYYWPNYTPITSAADHDIMLFTVSKSTGHAGSRIGWALVKDEAVARKMVKFIELSTIGTSKEAQLRAGKVLDSICDDYLDFSSSGRERFFEYGYRVMADRWEKLREAVKCNGRFTLLEYPENYCNFMGKYTCSAPGFAWMECKDGEEDGAALMKEHKILARQGPRFGVDKKYMRISMLDTDESFNVFLGRLAKM